jgi:dCMP deaminase
MYVSLFPCNECAKAIIQSGIKTVVYEDDKYDGSPENMASKRMFLDAGVVLIQLPYCLKVCVEEIEE